MIGKISIITFLILKYVSCFVPTQNQNHNIINNQIVSTLNLDEKNLDSRALHEIRKQDWINRSVDYYFRVTREKTHISSSASNEEIADLEQAEIATRLYFARTKIKNGSPHHAEQIYRKIINEIMNSDTEEHCDHSALAVSTLLLALLLQRMGDVKGTRSAFLNFFRVIQANEGIEEMENCACSAKVLQAFALFEMKQGNSRKSYELVNKAVNMDKSLEGVLRWKQFRDVSQQLSIYTP